MVFQKGHTLNKGIWSGKTYEEIFGLELAQQIKKKQSIARLGKKYSEESRKKMSIAKSGKNHPNYGKHRSEETKIKIGLGNLGKNLKERIGQEIIKCKCGCGVEINKYDTRWREVFYVKGHTWKGKTFSEETKQKLSIKKLGKPLSEEIKQKMSLSHIGKEISEEHRKNISIANKGKIFSEEHRNNISKIKKEGYKEGKLKPICYWKGKIFSEEHRKNMSESAKGRIFSEEHRKNMGKNHRDIKGDKNPLWNNGSSFEPYTTDFNKAFKESIRERDNYCCSICNRMQEELMYKLHVHHIDYDKKNTLPQNCIALCRNHHADTNMNRQSWIKFFHSLLTERYAYEYTEDQKIVLDFTKEVTYDK